MRFGLLMISILLTGAIAQNFLPWWTLVLVAFVWGYFLPLRSAIRSFGAGFLAGALLWGVYAFYLSSLNEGLLAEKIGQLLGGLPAASLPVLSGLFAGVLTGMGALSGRLGWALYRLPNG